MRTLFVVLILIPVPAIAGMDMYQQQALHQTQDVLTKPAERQKVLDKDPKAKEMDDKVGALAGSPTTKDKMYGLASQLLQTLVQNGYNDPQKLQELIQEAQKDPKGFYDKYFTAEQKAQVRGLAEEIQGHKTAIPDEK